MGWADLPGKEKVMIIGGGAIVGYFALRAIRGSGSAAPAAVPSTDPTAATDPTLTDLANNQQVISDQVGAVATQLGSVEHILSTVSHSGSPVAPSRTPSKTPTYTVRAGDSLSKIAGRFHESWQQLYRDNESAIGSDPNMIHPGLVLHK